MLTFWRNWKGNSITRLSLVDYDWTINRISFYTFKNLESCCQAASFIVTYVHMGPKYLKHMISPINYYVGQYSFSTRFPIISTLKATPTLVGVAGMSSILHTSLTIKIRQFSFLCMYTEGSTKPSFLQSIERENI